ncbi:MAG: heavy metal translocating P-type ATPase [Porphyromonas sp.]|nr:heavy metal translocating P-type ATPase [Porphyromonas sp.]
MDNNDNCKACAIANGHVEPEAAHGHDHSGGTQEGEVRRLWTNVIISTVILIAALVLQHGTYSDAVPHWMLLGLYILSFIPVGFPVIQEAWELTTEHHDYFNECTLMTVAAIGAFSIGDYPEAVMLMALYSIGEVLQTKAVSRARRSISDLVNDHAQVVQRLNADGTREEVAPEEVLVGDKVRALVGDRLALDGVLLSDSATLDLSALTGESVPVEVLRGEPLLAGAVVQGHPIEMEVTKPYKDSTLSRILHMAEEAAERKPETEHFIRRFSRVYTPIVLVLAVLVVAVPWLVSLLHPTFTYDFSKWFYSSLVFLVTSCPCALIISVPLSYFSGLGASSRHGLLFKGSIFIEKLRHTTAVVFDKTGTITEGSFEVADLQVYGGTAEEEALALLVAVESGSTHPIAQAILSYAEEKTLPEVAVSKLHEQAGFGLRAKDSHSAELLAGNARLLRESGVEIADHQTDTGTTVYLARGGVLILTVVLQDKLKPTSTATVAELHRKGVTPVTILSGDRQAVVEQVGAEVGVDRAIGGLLPQDKMREVELLMHEKEDQVVTYVGDGLNDAPVMSMSDIGVAMGGIASDATVEAADIVIQGTDPYKLVQAIEISNFTHKIVIQNIVFALSFKIVVMLLATFGIASLALAIMADVGVALLTVVNSIRVLRFKAKAPTI